MVYSKALFVFLLFLSLGQLAQSRSVRFDTYNSSDGLSENNVYAIYKDSHGFMWFGTDDGLNRFDGYSFAVYRPNDVGDKLLPGNRVRCIAETKGQDILVGFENDGLCLLDRNTDIAEPYLLPLELGDSIAEYSVYDIEPYADSLFWVATDYGIHVFNPHSGFAGKLMKGVQASGGLSSNQVRSIHVASSGFVWIAHENGRVDKYNPASNESYAYDLGPFAKTSIGEDGFGNIWVGSWGGGIVRIAPSGDTLRYGPDSLSVGDLSDSVVSYNSIAADELGRLWIGTLNKGLNELSLRNGSENNYFFIKHRAKDLDQLSIADDAVLSVYYDGDENLWVGHRGAGISKINLFPKKFYNYILDFKDGLGRNAQVLLPARDNHLWVGTQSKALQLFDGTTNRFVDKAIGTLVPKLPSSPDVSSLALDSADNIWIGTKGGGLFRYSAASKKMLSCNATNRTDFTLKLSSINSVFVDSLQNVYVAGTKGGLYLKNDYTKQFVEIPLPSKSIKTPEILKIDLDADGYLWLCTKQNGAFYFRPQQFPENIQFVNVAGRSKHSKLSHFTVHDIVQPARDEVWIATGGGGINIFNRKTGQISVLGVKEGLPTGVVRSLEYDNAGKVWIATHLGIVSCNVVDKQLRLYNREDGLMTVNFLDGAACLCPDGRIVFGADNGFIAFRPDQITSRYDVPKVVFTDLKIFNIPVSELPDVDNYRHLLGPLHAKDEVRLHYKDYVFSIDFAAIELNTPQKTEYEYMLEGFDNKWIGTDAKNRTATYTNLPGGTYTFKVKAANGDGIWSKEPSLLKIRITPPFWETWWFAVLSILIALLGLLATFWYRGRVYDRRRKVLESLVEMRTREVRLQKEELLAQKKTLETVNITKDKFFSIIAHDLKSPFNAFIGFTSMLKNNFSEYSDDKKLYILDVISNSAQVMFELLNNLLSWARAQSGSIEYMPEKLKLRMEVDSVCLLNTTSAGEKRINIVNAVPEEIKIVADKNLLAAVLRNLISNGIKFTPELGCITIAAKLQKQECCITVTDTGVGMTDLQLQNLFKIDSYGSTPGTNKEKGTGLGLVVAKEFIEINRGSININSTHGQGTQVEFTLPIA